ncbi:hypothetical protein [Paenibacillus lautus]|uniref:hypothetical protein n=1 Tax=Paenibacillus lautus TaxID=1401 RepID=UPI0013C40F22|nr:hypothetical protein [Paenibacillus lautus]
MEIGDWIDLAVILIWSIFGFYNFIKAGRRFEKGEYQPAIYHALMCVAMAVLVTGWS